MRRLVRWGRKQALCVGVGGAALAVLAGTALPAATGAAAASADAAVTLSGGPLGIDVAPWTNPNTLSAVQPLLKAAGVDQLHYGGGSTADEYDWQTNTDIANCPNTTLAEFTAACANKDLLPFSQYSASARALGAQSMVTVNYGTGTTAMAKAWVAQAASAAGQGVADFEIGNENYGCWEDNNWLAAPPENFKGYVAQEDDTCPLNPNGDQKTGMEIMAKSYAANAGDYMAAMKAANPDAQLGVPYAFDWTVGGANVADNAIWNDTILGQDAADISFVDAHWYPDSFGGNTGAPGNPTDQEVIQSVTQIPGEYAKIQADLNAYDPTAKVIVGETGVSYRATNVPCTPAGALFAAGDVLSWLAAGAQTVDWWPLDTDANQSSKCANPDEGMLTATGAPMSTYTGYVLASALAQPNAKLSVLTTGNSQVLGFQSILPNGHPVVAYINMNTTTAERETATTALTGSLLTTSYSAAHQNATSTETVAGTSTASAVAGGITLPAESILVLKEDLRKPSAMALTTGGSSNTFKAGTKVTLKGKLTLNGAAAPAGVPVKVAREVSGKTQTTLTVKTVAGGTYTVTDVPPATGTYVYAASYLSNTYKPAMASYTVKVAAAKPALKLTVSAKAVRPGKKVVVTATLGAPHTDRTLVIYAQVKGGAKKVIKRGTLNSKGQVAVAFPMKANTTFTVAFAGDTWYTAGSATAVVAA